MRLVIATPLAIAAQLDAVAAIRAEDEAGHFGIRPRHAEFITALAVSVVSWTLADGTEGRCAVRGGLLTVGRDDTVTIATADAVMEAEPGALEARIIAELAAQDASERQASQQTERLRVETIRRAIGLLRPNPAQAPTIGS